jgi:hypothetical protein
LERSLQFQNGEEAGVAAAGEEIWMDQAEVRDDSEGRDWKE